MQGQCKKTTHPFNVFFWQNSTILSFLAFFTHQIFGNFSSVHLSHVELKNMGQQSETGRYPVHFHMCGDVDQRGGYWEPTYVDGLSIHHSFSRCLTIHATNGLLVGLKKKKKKKLQFECAGFYM